MSYANTAIRFGGASANIYGAQFVNCQNGMNLGGANVFIGNGLFANNKTNFIFQGSSTVTANNVTVNNALMLATAPATFSASSLALTNCVLANVTNLTNGVVTLSGGCNGFYNTPNFGSATVFSYNYPFQSVGAGNYYLTNGSPFRNVGTTNLDPTLLASLRQKTTYPPIVCSNITFWPRNFFVCKFGEFKLRAGFGIPC